MIEGLFKAKKLREQVKEELNHIPRGDLDQNLLRAMFWDLRSHSLGKNAKEEKTKEDVLIESTKLMKRDNKNFCPRFNENFFDMKKLCGKTKNDKSLNICFVKKGK